MSKANALLFITSVFLASVAQVLLKTSAKRQYSMKRYEYFNLHVICAYSLFLLCTFLTVLAFRGIDLKYGPAFESLGYIFVLILGKIFLNEIITPKKMIGNALIVIGVIVFFL